MRSSGGALGRRHDMSTVTLETLVERGEEQGCINLSEFAELTHELSDDEAQALADRLEQRGIEVSDDCGRAAEPGPTYAIDELSHMTGDTLQLFLRDVRRHPLLTAKDEVELAKRIEQRRPRGEGAHGQLEPPPGGLAREEVPGARAVPARPDPGGDPRPDPRGREVRLAQGLQVLHLRDLLDPPGDPARPRQPGPDDPAAGAHRPARAQDREGRARAVHPASAARRPTRRSRGRPTSRCASSRRRASSAEP